MVLFPFLLPTITCPQSTTQVLWEVRLPAFLEMRAPVPICKWLHAVLRRGAPPLLGRWGALPGTPTTGNFPLAPHPFHVQVTVTLSPHLLAPLCSWFFTRFLCNPEQSLGNGKPEAALLHGSLCWGHWSILNLALTLLAASLTGPDPQAHLPFQHWHSPNPQLGSAAVQNWGWCFS